jgi:hypothetical protein
VLTSKSAVILLALSLSASPGLPPRAPAPSRATSLPEGLKGLAFADPEAPPWCARTLTVTHAGVGGVGVTLFEGTRFTVEVCPGKEVAY